MTALARRLAFALAFLAAAPAGARGDVTIRDKIDDGDHWRIMTEHGAVHIWRPVGYDADTAGLVVYLHGYYNNVDETWAQHRMADQFRDAGKSALYVVPEAPVSMDDDVKWPSLGDLLRAVFDQTGLRRPDGPLVVIGHSAAYRTLVPWLEYPPLDHVILLDAMYGNEQDYLEWLQRSKGHAWHRLTIVSQDTVRFAEPFTRRLRKDGVILKSIPDKWEDFTPRAREARCLYMRSQYGHMTLVGDGKVIPLLLKRVPLRDVKPEDGDGAAENLAQP